MESYHIPLKIESGVIDKRKDEIIDKVVETHICILTKEKNKSNVPESCPRQYLPEETNEG